MATKKNTKAKKKKSTTKNPKLEIYTIEGAQICQRCDDRLYKAIEVRLAMCDGCNHIGCEHFVSVDEEPGSGVCIGDYGCAPERNK